MYKSLLFLTFLPSFLFDDFSASQRFLHHLLNVVCNKLITWYPFEASALK